MAQKHVSNKYSVFCHGFCSLDPGQEGLCFSAEHRMSLCLGVWEFHQGEKVKSVSRKTVQWPVWSVKHSKWKSVEKSPSTQWAQNTARVKTMTLWPCAAQGAHCEWEDLGLWMMEFREEPSSLLLVLTALSSGPEGAEREAAAACLASVVLLETVTEYLTVLCGFPLTLSLPGASQN